MYSLRLGLILIVFALLAGSSILFSRAVAEHSPLDYNCVQFGDHRYVINGQALQLYQNERFLLSERVFSPTGQHMLIQRRSGSGAAHQDALVLREVGGGRSRVLWQGAAVLAVFWQAENNWVAVYSRDLGSSDDRSQATRLDLVDLRSLVHVTVWDAVAGDVLGQWLPNDRLLLLPLVANQSLYHIIDAKSGRVERLALRPDVLFTADPLHLAPDGNTLLDALSRDQVVMSDVRRDPLQPQVLPLPVLGGEDVVPVSQRATWSPDSRHVLVQRVFWLQSEATQRRFIHITLIGQGAAGWQVQHDWSLGLAIPQLNPKVMAGFSPDGASVMLLSNAEGNLPATLAAYAIARGETRILDTNIMQALRRGNYLHTVSRGGDDNTDTLRIWAGVQANDLLATSDPAIAAIDIMSSDMVRLSAGSTSTYLMLDDAGTIIFEQAAGRSAMVFSRAFPLDSSAVIGLLSREADGWAYLDLIDPSARRSQSIRLPEFDGVQIARGVSGLQHFVAPDGAWVALTLLDRILLVNIESGETKRLPPPRPMLMSWAPDSSAIAYGALNNLSGQNDVDLYVYVLGEPAPVFVETLPLSDGGLYGWDQCGTLLERWRWQD